MKIKVGVLFGGNSVEHEVSVISALQACNSFNKEKYEIIPVYITKSGQMYCGDGIGEITEYSNIPALLKKSQRVILVSENGKLNIMRYPMKKFGDNLINTIDVAFPIVHGTNVEDGTLQGYLHTLGVPYVGCDVVSSAVGMDKYVMKAVLKYNDIPVLDCKIVTVKEYTVNIAETKATLESKIGYPMIVKPINLGSSVGIKIARNGEELEEAMEYAFQFANKVLAEHAIMNLKEINCSVCGDYEEAEASECEEPVNSDEILSYEDKYVSGGKSGSGKSGMSSLKRKIPAEISPETREEIRTMAVKAFKCLGCSGVSRIDFMIDMDSGKVYLNEINTIPGSLAFYLWEPVGVKYPQLLDRMVSLALKRQREEEALTFSFETNILNGVSFGGKLGGAKGGKLNG